MYVQGITEIKVNQYFLLTLYESVKCLELYFSFEYVYFTYDHDDGRVAFKQIIVGRSLFLTYYFPNPCNLGNSSEPPSSSNNFLK